MYAMHSREFVTASAHHWQFLVFLANANAYSDTCKAPLKAEVEFEVSHRLRRQRVYAVHNGESYSRTTGDLVCLAMSCHQIFIMDISTNMNHGLRVLVVVCVSVAQGRAVIVLSSTMA